MKRKVTLLLLVPILIFILSACSTENNTSSIDSSNGEIDSKAEVKEIVDKKKDAEKVLKKIDLWLVLKVKWKARVKSLPFVHIKGIIWLK